MLTQKLYYFPIQTAQKLKRKLPRRLIVHESTVASTGNSQKVPGPSANTAEPHTNHCQPPIHITASRVRPHTHHCQQGGPPYTSLPAGGGGGGVGGSWPLDFTVLNETLYFVADDGTNGFELWKYGGEDPPSMVKDINLNGDAYDQWDFTLAAYDGVLYFGANNGSDGYEFWAHNPEGWVV